MAFKKKARNPKEQASIPKVGAQSRVLHPICPRLMPEYPCISKGTSLRPYGRPWWLKHLRIRLPFMSYLINPICAEQIWIKNMANTLAGGVGVCL